MDASVLDEVKLKAQADKLYAAFCALLVKQRPEPIELIALIHAVGITGHDRSSYAGAATVAFAQLATCDLGTMKVKNVLIFELKRILASRHCIQWQPKIIPILSALGITTSTSLIMDAELDRMREIILSAHDGGKKNTAETDGERALAISEIADGMKVPDEENAIALCSVRAQSPAELAKLALAMLSRLPKKFDDASMALVKINRSAAAASSGGSIGFEHRIRALKSVGIGVKNFFDTNTADNTSDEEMDIVDNPPSASDGVSMPNHPTAPRPSFDPSQLLDAIIQRGVDKKTFSKLLLKTWRGSDEMIVKFFHNQLSTSGEGVVDLFSMVYREQLLGDHEDGISLDRLGELFVSAIRDQMVEFNIVRTIISAIPCVPPVVFDYVDNLIETSSDVLVKRNGLTILANFVLAKPGFSNDCLSRILNHCSSDHESVRTDALKLVIARLYKPSSIGIPKWQWPYQDLSCPMKIVDSLDEFADNRLQLLCSEQIEIMAKKRFESAAENGSWNTVWPMLALCSKKPLLIHFIVSCLVENNANTSHDIPTNYVQSFGSSLAALPGDVIDKELEIIVKEYKGVRSVNKRRKRNEFVLPILSAISGTSRGLTNKLADAALSFSK